MSFFDIFCLLFWTLSAFAASVPSVKRQSAWPAPEPCTGNCTFIHDPAVIRADDGTYYRLSTNGNIAIATAPDLTGPWEYQGAMLPEGSSITLIDKQEMWAPDVYRYDGTYYCFYSVSNLGLQNSSIGVATSPTMEFGTWVDHGAVNIPLDPRWNIIDGNLFNYGPDEPWYFNFGSAWDTVFQTQLTPESGFIDQPEGIEPSQMLYNSTFPVGGNKVSITEGAYLFWWPSEDIDYHYMFFSSGACCNKAFNGGEGDWPAPGDEYKVMVCRSESPSGPFVDMDGRDCVSEDGGSLVLGSHDNIYAPGGQGVFYESDSGRVVMYYHYVDLNLPTGYLYEEFLFGFNYLDFSSGWPVVVPK
ncbi:hypothetical protein FQN54_005622 [Arachnomyces sp. PD_36]|nr:hypothetical protein FQN54_005622 [Arachnomyces sp. PD_36]